MVSFRKPMTVIRHPATTVVMGILVGVLCGFLVHPYGFAIAWGLSIPLLLGFLLPWLTILRLAVDICPARSRSLEGEEVRWDITVRNRAPWPVYGIAVEVPATAEERFSFWVPSVPAWGSRTATEVCIPQLRGKIPSSAIEIHSGFPFGFWTRRATIPCTTRLLVLPKARRRHIPRPTGPPAWSGTRTRALAGTSGLFLGVRPYRTGDSIRRIHWPQSSRHDRLMICEQESPTQDRVVIQIDHRTTSHAGQGAKSSFEECVRVALGLVRSARASGCHALLRVGQYELDADDPLFLEQLALIPPLATNSGPCVTSSDAHQGPVVSEAAIRETDAPTFHFGVGYFLTGPSGQAPSWATHVERVEGLGESGP